MSRRFVFNPASIDALIEGDLKDPTTPGLAIVVLKSGKKSWRYLRRIPGTEIIVKLTFGTFPARTIPAARKWATELNEQVENGIDPRETMKVEAERADMTLKRAHELYMAAVREGRASRAKRKNKPRTIDDKQEIYDRDVPAKLKRKSIYDVTERDLIDIVVAKGKAAKVRANRLAAELKVFFGWAASLRGLEVGLDNDPSRRLGDLKFPESPRQRKLSEEELEWYLKAVAEEEERDFRRGLLLLLLTATRISELTLAHKKELKDGIWTIPPERSKNHSAHSIKLGPWGLALMQTNAEWILPAPRVDGPRKSGWYKARDRVLARMSAYAGRAVEKFNPHDCRRTARSNTKRLKVDYETAEAMLNHLKAGMERIYDGYELEAEMAAWFLKWENEIIRIARKAGVADKLEIPQPVPAKRAPNRLRPGACRRARRLRTAHAA